MFKFKFHILSLKAQPFLWVILAIALCVFALLQFWSMILPVAGDLTKSSEIIRNVVLALAAIVALPLVVWGRISAQKSADASHRSAQSALQTVQTKIFVDAVDQLGSEKSSTRIAAIYSFKELVEEVENKAFKTKVSNVLKSYLEEELRVIWDDYYEENRKTKCDDQKRIYVEVDINTKSLSLPKSYMIASDKVRSRSVEFREIIKIIKISFEIDEFDILPDLSGINLKGVDLSNLKFFGWRFKDANFIQANLQNTDFFVRLNGAHLSNAELQGANLTGATGIEEADFAAAKYNSKTKFPEGFNPEAHNMIKVAD